MCFRVERITCHHDRACPIPFSKYNQLSCRIFAPASLLGAVEGEFRNYLSKCMQAIQDLFGPSPFPRLDIMLYPRSSQDMAMAK